VTEPKPETQRNVTYVRDELDEELPVTEDELDLVEAWLRDLIAELLSEVPEEMN